MTSMNLGEVGDVDDSTESRSVNLPTIVIYITAVQNPMKMSDISFLKTKLNWTDLKIQKPKTQFPQFGFQKPTSAIWRQFFTLSHSQFILHHDSINSQSIFLHAVSLYF